MVLFHSFQICIHRIMTWIYQNDSWQRSPSPPGSLLLLLWLFSPKSSFTAAPWLTHITGAVSWLQIKTIIDSSISCVFNEREREREREREQYLAYFQCSVRLTKEHWMSCWKCRGQWSMWHLIVLLMAFGGCTLLDNRRLSVHRSALCWPVFSCAPACR